MCHSDGSLFHKKTLNMGPIFYKNIPKHSLYFQNFGVFAMGIEHPKIGPIFEEKCFKMGTFFCQNDP